MKMRIRVTLHHEDEQEKRSKTESRFTAERGVCCLKASFLPSNFTGCKRWMLRKGYKNVSKDDNISANKAREGSILCFPSIWSTDHPRDPHVARDHGVRNSKSHSASYSPRSCN